MAELLVSNPSEACHCSVSTQGFVFYSMHHLLLKRAVILLFMHILHMGENHRNYVLKNFTASIFMGCISFTLFSFIFITIGP